MAKGKSNLVTYDSDKKAAEKRSRAAKKGHTPAKPGNQLHEFPPKMAKEGGAGAVVNEIPAGENASEGGASGALIKSSKLITGDKLLYDPVPDTPDPDPSYSPIPAPSPSTSNSPSLDPSAVKTGVEVGTGMIAGYIVYKTVVAALTWECGGCGIFVTP